MISASIEAWLSDVDVNVGHYVVADRSRLCRRAEAFSMPRQGREPSRGTPDHGGAIWAVAWNIEDTVGKAGFGLP